MDKSFILLSIQKTITIIASTTIQKSFLFLFLTKGRRRNEQTKKKSSSISFEDERYELLKKKRNLTTHLIAKDANATGT